MLDTEGLAILTKLWIWALLLLIKFCPRKIKKLKLEIFESVITEVHIR